MGYQYCFCFLALACSAWASPPEQDHCYFFDFVNMTGAGWHAVLHMENPFDAPSNMAINSSNFTRILCPTGSGAYYFSVHLVTTKEIALETNSNSNSVVKVKNYLRNNI